MGRPQRVVERTQPSFARQPEQVQALSGEMPGRPEKAAVTRESIEKFGAVAIKARYATAAPTMAEYNALVEDMRAIASLLNKIGANFTGM